MSGKAIAWSLQRLQRICEPDRACWIWQGYCAGTTPVMSYMGKVRPVRRVALELLGVKVHKGWYVLGGEDCAECCVNPAHVVQLNSTQYMARLNRLGLINGMKTKIGQAAAGWRRAALTVEQAEAARLAVAAGEDRGALCARYGVSRRCLNAAVRQAEAAHRCTVPAASVFSWRPAGHAQSNPA